MRVQPDSARPGEAGADTVAVGLFAGDEAPAALASGAVAELLASGEARTEPRRLAHTHAGGVRWIVVGLGEREAFDPERARVAAALVQGRARDLRARTLQWAAPAGADAVRVAPALAEGVLLADYRFD